MSRFYKTTKTPTVDYAYVYPFDELFKAMKYKQDRHDKALESLQAGYDEFLDLKYRPADAAAVMELRRQAEEFMNNASNMPLHNAQGYITQGINGLMNNQLVKDIATNYDNWVVQEQAKQNLIANEQWHPDSQHPYSDTPTSEIPGNISSFMHTPQANWRDDAERYFDNMNEAYQNAQGVRAEARAGAPQFVASGPGYNALVDIYGQKLVDSLYQQAKGGDQNATSRLNKMAEDILFDTGREIYDIQIVEENKNNKKKNNVPNEDYAESLYNQHLGNIITSPTGALMNSDNINFLAGNTESKFNIPNAFQVTPSNLTSYNELDATEMYVWDPQSESYTLQTVTEGDLANARLQNLQIQTLNTFMDSPYYTYYEELTNINSDQRKELQEWKVDPDGLQHIKDFLAHPTRHNKVRIPKHVLMAIDHTKYHAIHNNGISFDRADFGPNGELATFFTDFENALIPKFGSESLTNKSAIINQNVAPGDGVLDYNSQIRNLRNIGIVDPFDPKWKKLIDKVNTDKEENDATKINNKQLFNKVLHNNGASFDFTPNAGNNVTTRMVMGDDGNPKMVMVVDGHYTLGYQDLNKIFSRENGFDGENGVKMGAEVDLNTIQALMKGENPDYWTSDNWIEYFYQETDRDFVTKLVHMSTQMQTIPDGKGGTIKIPLFEIPATIEIPIDANLADDYNKEFGQYKTGQIANLTSGWNDEWVAILQNNIANQTEKLDIQLADSRVVGTKSRFKGLISDPDVTLYDETTNSFIDARPKYITQWFEDSEQGILTHLNEAFPDGKGAVYTDMVDIITELREDLNAHVNGTGNAEDFESSLSNLAILHSMLNPSDWDEGVFLSNNEKQRKFRAFVNNMDSASGFYDLDDNNTNEDIGIVNGEVTNAVNLRKASRNYASKNNLIEFDHQNYSTIEISDKMYAPFVSKNTDKAIAYLDGLDLGGNLTITGLMRIPGYDKIVGKSAHPGTGSHTEGRALDLRVSTASDELFAKWNTSFGRQEMIANGIVNMIFESGPDHYHIEIAPESIY
tara:strand:- start:46 stop:3132 length:3087 start_codon:yes stop_codon:yes gene_type:complete